MSNAIRAFKNSVTVTAVSVPNCERGATDCLLGNVVITETQNGQLKAGQMIFGWILPRSTTLRNDVRIKASNTNDLPIITTNAASGLLVSPVQVICPPVIPLIQICVFASTVTQQSFGPTLGQITISNMHATVTPDAVLGPIQTEWSNSLSSLGITTPPPVTGQVFDSIITNGTDRHRSADDQDQRCLCHRQDPEPRRVQRRDEGRDPQAQLEQHRHDPDQG